MISLRSFFDFRKWLIVTQLLILNIKYYRFHSSLLNKINPVRKHSSFRIYPSELAFAQYWNAKLSIGLSFLGASYTLCMKRCFVLALIIDCEQPFDYVIGVNPVDYNDGHAWLMINGVIATYYPEGINYRALKTLRIE